MVDIQTHKISPLKIKTEHILIDIKVGFTWVNSSYEQPVSS